jgi:hypothetical protein
MLCLRCLGYTEWMQHEEEADHTVEYGHTGEACNAATLWGGERCY